MYSKAKIHSHQKDRTYWIPNANEMKSALDSLQSQFSSDISSNSEMISDPEDPTEEFDRDDTPIEEFEKAETSSHETSIPYQRRFVPKNTGCGVYDDCRKHHYPNAVYFCETIIRELLEMPRQTKQLSLVKELLQESCDQIMDKLKHKTPKVLGNITKKYYFFYKLGG